MCIVAAPRNELGHVGLGEQFSVAGGQICRERININFATMVGAIGCVKARLCAQKCNGGVGIDCVCKCNAGISR